MTSFPYFYGRKHESASNFLDDLEMAFLVSGRDDDEVKLRAFPLVLRDEAKTWFQGLPGIKKNDWDTLKETFLSRYANSSSPEKLWEKLTYLQQVTIGSYAVYETQFLKLWNEWEASLPEGERAPNFLQKERFLAGLSPVLQEKVRGKFPENFEEAMHWAKAKDRKLQFQSGLLRRELQPLTNEQSPQPPPAPPVTPEDPHLELLQRVTNQLDNLSINLVQGPRMQPQPRNEERMQDAPPPRRPPARRQEYFCYNCGEDGHGMYFCPHPRRYPGNGQGRGPRRQVTPPRERPQAPVQPPLAAQPQILRRPQPAAAIPPLPEAAEERAVNVIQLESKGKEKVREPEVMPIKKARVSEEVTGPPASMAVDEEGTSKDARKRKKRSSARRKITIKDFPLGSKEEPYDLIEDVSSQGPKLTWPQLLHLSPKMRRQWSKMVSTRATKVMGAVEARKDDDVLPVLEAYVKGQRIHKVYVDGGAQVCVMSEKMMNRLGLEVHGKSQFKAKMANNVSVKCVGVCKNVKITVCGVKVAVDLYVIPAKGEGYPIILGRPWLIAMNARQDWEKGTLILKPPGKGIKPIMYNMKEGKQESLDLETSEEELSTSDSSSASESTDQSSSEYDNSLEVCGITLKEPTVDDGEYSKSELKDEELDKMLAKDLSTEEKEEFKVMLRKTSRPSSSLTMVRFQVLPQ